MSTGLCLGCRTHRRDLDGNGRCPDCRRRADALARERACGHACRDCGATDRPLEGERCEPCVETQR